MAYKIGDFVIISYLYCLVSNSFVIIVTYRGANGVHLGEALRIFFARGEDAELIGRVPQRGLNCLTHTTIGVTFAA